MYHYAATTEDGNGELIKAKWRSIINHVHKKHKRHSEEFPKCAHGRLHSKKKWIKPRKLFIFKCQ